MQPDAPPITESRVVRHGTMWFIVFFWFAQYSLMTIQRRIGMPEAEDWSYLVLRAGVTMLGIGLSFVIARIFARFLGRPIRTRLIVACAAALGGCLLHAAGNFIIFQTFMPEANWEDLNLLSYLAAVVYWFWGYLALAGLLLALSYSVESSERERRIAQLRGIADAAQLRALRYQLNPHFMFNTLNSIAALIAQRAIGPAELMVENLSDFLRASLTLDPQEDITLDREIELQSLYLAIEAVRFSDRFETRIDIADDARRALVPSLVLQPLIENVVRHSVSTSASPVILTIHAEVQAGRLNVSVTNTASDGSGHAKGGTGVGLANVAARLEARFGDRCAFTAGPEPDRGFAVRFSIPFMEAV